MNQESLISIGLPIYNSGESLKRALDALLSQTYKNIEVIISDDTSTEEFAPRVCGEYAQKDNRVRYIRQEKNLGHRGNFEFVVHAAKGEYFMWAADDDWWEPGFIEKLKNALDEKSEYKLAMSSFRRVYNDGEIIDDIVFKGKTDLSGRTHRELLLAAMDYDNPIDQVFYGLYRTKFLQTLFRNPFPNVIAHDRVFMCEVAAATRIITLPEVLWHKTVHRKSLTERYGGQDVGKALKDKHRRTRYVWAVVGRLIGSSAISSVRKIALSPVYIWFLWRNKGYMLYEFSPSLYRRLSRKIGIG